MRFTKSLLTAATALALLAGPALAQPNQYQHPDQSYHSGPGGQPPHNDGHNNYGHDNDGHGPQGGPGNMGHQDYHQESHNNYHHGPSGPQGHWARGDHYDGHRVVIAHGDWNRYHLRQPPHGYEWVNSGGQFLLIAVTSGVIASIIANSAY